LWNGAGSRPAARPRRGIALSIGLADKRLDQRVPCTAGAALAFPAEMLGAARLADVPALLARQPLDLA
jgi:hypothetical protein